MRRELLPLLKLAGPVVLAEIGWMSMGIVDTLMVGPLGPAAIGATGMGSAVFTAGPVREGGPASQHWLVGSLSDPTFGMGLMLGLDALVSQAYGARQTAECLRWLCQGVWLALALAPFAMAAAWVAFISIDWWGLHPDVRTLGAPAASQVTLEVGVFAAATALAGRLDPTSSAANQIALNIASLAFMVPLGLSSAGAVRVGHAVGARDPRRAVHAGWTALAVGGAVMAAIAVALFVWPGPMLRAFTTDLRVIEIGTGLLAIAAAFQLFDDTQAVATGVLRGLGDTRTPMIMNVVGHWVFGLPVGYALCFTFGWGVPGLWIGLSIGLVFVAVALTGAWARQTRHLTLPDDARAPALPDLL